MKNEAYGERMGRFLYGLEGLMGWMKGPGWGSKIALMRHVGN